MSFLEIITYPDPILRKIAEPVKDVTDEIIKLSENMVERMYLAHGAGLAANQVGVSLRLIVLDPQLKKNNKPIIVINPSISEKDSEEISDEEGCLSVPKYSDYVKRSKIVYVKGITLKGKVFEMECEGHFARAFQHEIDHLNGIVFIDYLSPVKKHLFKKQYLKNIG
jgi:peptide deformylase